MCDTKRKIRVLHYFTGGDIVGGEETLAGSIAKRWKKHDVEPVILYAKRGKMWKYFQEAGIPLVECEIGGWLDWGALTRIEKIVKEYKVDIIQTHGPGFSEIIFGMVARKLSVPWVATRPNIMSLLFGRSKSRQLIYRVIDHCSLKAAKRIVCLSEIGVQGARQLSWVPKKKTAIIFNGVDIEKFQSVATNEVQEKDTINIAMVGALKPIKGWFDFIDVIKQLQSEAIQVKATIVGDGPLKAEILEKINKLGLTGVIELVGWRDDINAILPTMDIFLFTSYSEGMAVSILEAMASGLPVVCTDVGAARDQVLSGKNGYVVAAGDVTDMVAKCSALIRSSQLRKQLGQASREIAVKQFSEEIMVSEYATLYNTILSEKNN